jgi:hypothetical protein
MACLTIAGSTAASHSGEMTLPTQSSRPAGEPPERKAARNGSLEGVAEQKSVKGPAKRRRQLVHRRRGVRAD